MEGAARPAVNRALHHAIALSLALHGVMLFGLSIERKAAPREVPPPPLEARLAEPAAPLPPPQVEPETPPAPPLVTKPKPRPKPKPRLAKPAPAPLPQPEPAPAPSPPPPVAEPAPATQPSVARIEPRPAPPGPSAEQLEAITREQYRLQIIDVARGHNRYPPLARENNWEGEVLVRMVIGADGAVSRTVRRSSSHAVLDRQALEMFRRAQAAVPLPAALRGRPLDLEFRAVYNLKDQVSG